MITKKIILTFGFWVIYYFVLTFLFSGYVGFARSLRFSVIIVSFQAVLTYINLYLCIPFFLKKKRIFLYVLSVLIVILILSVIRFQIPSLLGELAKSLIKMRSRIIFFELNLVLVYFISTAYYFIAEWFNNMQLKAEMKLQQVESELKYLKNQVNPHFLFNTLNNIYTLCYLKDDKAAPAVMKLTEMMRYMLHDSNTSFIELEKEVSFIKNYIELQQFKKETEMKISFEINGVKGRHKIAPLILIAFIENCFKHGDIAINPNGWIKVQINIDDQDTLYFYVANSKRKIGIEEQKKSEIGLENVRKRLDLLYEGKYNLQVNDEENEYIVVLNLKLNE